MKRGGYESADQWWCSASGDDDMMIGRWMSSSVPDGYTYASRARLEGVPFVNCSFH